MIIFRKELSFPLDILTNYRNEENNGIKPVPDNEGNNGIKPVPNNEENKEIKPVPNNEENKEIKPVPNNEERPSNMNQKRQYKVIIKRNSENNDIEFCINNKLLYKY